MNFPTKQEDAVEKLAERLHWKMEHLDPTTDGELKELSDHKKDFYRLCVKDLFS